MRSSEIAARLQCKDARIAVLHSQRREQPLLDKVIPALAGDSLNNLTRCKEHYVLVTESGPKSERRFEKADPADHFIAVIGRVIPDQVSAKGLKSAAVRNQIANCHLARDVGVIHLKPGEVPGDRVVPSEFTFVDQQAKRGSRECLGA